MTNHPEADDPNAEIDLADPRVAWNFGTRELTEPEYDQLAAAHHADFARWAEAQDADARFAAWARANPAEAQVMRTDAEAAASLPHPWDLPAPEAGSDPEAVVDGPGCSVRDLDAYEAAMDAALDEPEPEAEAG